jgi:hypothetical protein
MSPAPPRHGADDRTQMADLARAIDKSRFIPQFIDWNRPVIHVPPPQPQGPGHEIQRAALVVPAAPDRGELRQEVHLPRESLLHSRDNGLSYLRVPAVYVHGDPPHVPQSIRPAKKPRVKQLQKNKKRRRSGRRREHRRSFHVRSREEERISRSSSPNLKMVRGILGGGTQGGGESAAAIHECLREEERDIRLRISLAHDAVSGFQCFRPQARPVQAKIRQSAVIQIAKRLKRLAVQAVIVDTLEELAYSGADLKGEGRVGGPGVMCKGHGVILICTNGASRFVC